ncbi:MAG: hypothetical protein ACKPKO_53450 [Candidatus Fonsibacter sp.]
MPKFDKTYVDCQVALKANQFTTYTEVEVDGIVLPKSDKTYVDAQLALKANQLNTYTKTGYIQL